MSSRARDLVEAVRNPARFSPASCRDRVLQDGFTHLDMARKYLSYYEKVLATGRLGEPGESQPMTNPGFQANDLLPWER